MPKVDSIGAGHFDAVRDGSAGSGGDASPEKDGREGSEQGREGAAPPADTDRLEAPPARVRAPAPSHPAGLPTGSEPGAEAQVAGMRSRLAELENTFQYIGTGHPDFAKIKAEIEQLRAMLAAHDRDR